MPPENQQHTGETWIGRLEWIVALILQFGIAIVTVSALIQGKWLLALSGLVVLMLTFTPAIIERQLHVPLPVEFTLITCIFLFASYAMGEVGDFYERFWWWDMALHGVSAVITGLIGFLALYVFYMTHRIRVAPIYVAILTFGLAVAVGTLWEIFEFLADWFLDLNMQRSGLVDTMTDLMINSLGAILAAAIGYYYVKNGDSLLGRRVIRILVDRLRDRSRMESDKP
jgi:hypothetical protein